MMNNSFFFAIIVIMISFVAVTNAARLLPLHLRQHKSNNDVESNRATNAPYIKEWINVSMKSDPVIKVPLGGMFELECEAVGNPPPRIVWYHKKNVILETGFSEQNEIENTAIGKIISRVVIDCFMPHHQGVYSCAGSSSVSPKKIPSPVTVVIEGSTDIPNLSCELEKTKAPRIITWGPTLVEFSDRDVILPCTAVGNPIPEVYWINNKDQVIDADIISSHHKVLENGDLLITRISWEDMGTYNCIAQNSFGHDKTESFLYPIKTADE